MRVKRLAIIFLIFTVASCLQPPASQSNKSSLSQSDLDSIADNLQLKYKLLDNRADDACDKSIADGACFKAQIILHAKQSISSDNTWSIYFSHIRPWQRIESQEFSFAYINGDLHRLKPTEHFKGFNAGESKIINFRASHWQLYETDVMPNYYLVAEGLQPRVIKNTIPKQDVETGLEWLQHVEAFTDKTNHFTRAVKDQTPWLTPSLLYEQNKSLINNPKLAEISLIPTPASISISSQSAKLDLSSGIKIKTNNVEYEQIQAALTRLHKLGVVQSSSGVGVSITVDNDSKQLAESYRLKINATEINITAASPVGAFYALQSLAGLIKVGSISVPVVTIVDQPRYSFRGMHLDVARNFHSKQLVKDLLQQMAAYKLNKLHLHLADDEGWRLEIPGLPELTEIASRRCHDLTETTCLLPQLGSGPHMEADVNGYYTVSDYQEILQTATDHHIQVIPSLDMPGHARAAVIAMQARYQRLINEGNENAARQYLLSDPNDKTIYRSVQNYNDNTINVCMPSAYTFIDKVITEMSVMHQQSGHPLRRYHIGADETAGAWLQSPVCKAFLNENKSGISDIKQLNAYFINQVIKILSANKIEPAAWSDGLKDVSIPDKLTAQANAWGTLFWEGHRTAHHMANQNWQVVLSMPDALYFDFPQAADPKERGYYWASRHTSLRKVFEFMPGNLPVHAEFWRDRDENAMQIKDDLPLLKNVHFTGLQGNLWSETVRSDDQVEYMIFPRLLALAERAWYKPIWELPYNYQGGIYNQNTAKFTTEHRKLRAQDWARFVNTISHKELAKLDLAGIEYRLPLAGAKITNEKLYMNSVFPSLGLEYRLDNGEWRAYAEPLEIKYNTIEVRTSSPHGKRKGRNLVLK